VSQQYENTKIANKKRSTLQDYQMTKGTGVVKKMIGEFEVMFMQLTTSTEQVEATVKAALARRKLLLNGLI
jgi:hypothetical protein